MIRMTLWWNYRFQSLLTHFLPQSFFIMKKANRNIELDRKHQKGHNKSWGNAANEQPETEHKHYDQPI